MRYRTHAICIGWFAIVLLLAPACDSTRESPVAPSYNASTPAAQITIAGPDSVLTGLTGQFDATAKLASGATIYHATGTWGVDDERVATITDRGVLTGHNPGTAIVTATYREASASATVRILPKPPSKPFPARANIVISYAPDPAAGSLSPCSVYDRGTPAWRYSMRIAETEGVGFTMKVAPGPVRRGRTTHLRRWRDGDECFAPTPCSSKTCLNLFGRPSGGIEDTLKGIDDNGNELTVTNRLIFSPVADACRRRLVPRHQGLRFAAGRRRR